MARVPRRTYDSHIVRASLPAIVDVGIPAHGRPRFLREAIESVLGQTLGGWRLVVSEDGPGGDAVADAVRPYLDDPRVSYRTTGRRLGAAANMTRLIGGGSAPYVGLLHDDDRWEPGFLARRVEFLETYPECGLVFSRSVIIDERGRPIHSHRPLVPAGVLPPERFAGAMLRRNVVPISTVLVRRSAYDAVGPRFDERFPHIYDYEMWLRIGARFPVARLDVCDAQWRRHGSQSSFDGRTRGEEMLAFLTHAERLIATELPALELAGRRRRYVRARRMVSASLDAAQQEQPRAALARLGEAVRTWPPMAVNPRVATALVGIACGTRGAHVVRTIRQKARWRGLRLPF